MANPTSTGLRPAQPHLIHVKQIRDLTPHLRCITFHSDTLHDYPAVDRHAAHIKVFLPRAGQTTPTLPQLTDRGPVWPEGQEKPLVRTYTVFAFRPQAGELDIVFALHDHNGPAVDFARHASPGDALGISLPGGPHPMLPVAESYYFAADPSSLPALIALLNALPSEAKGYVVVRVDHDNDRLTLNKPDGVILHWIVGPTESTPRLLEQFTHLPPPSDPATVFFWLAGEDSMVVQLRRYVRRELQIDKNRLYAIPYWRDGLNEEDYHQKRHDVMDNPDD